MSEVEAQIKEIEKNLKYIKENRESLEKIGEKMSDSNLKKLTGYLNAIELNSCGAIDEIISAQDNFKKEIKTVIQYFGEEEKNFKPVDFLKTISEFVKNFKKACM